MITILDLKAEFAKLAMLRDRRPDMLEAERRESGAFATLTPFRDGNIFAAKFSGNGAWERHPNGEELVQIVEGTATLHIIVDDQPQTHELTPGMLVVVPQGAWHRFEAPDGVGADNRDAEADRASDGRCRRPAHAGAGAAVGQRRRKVALRCISIAACGS